MLCTGIAYILYFRLIENAGPARALAVTFLVPVFAVFYGALFLGEAVTPWMLLCGAVIVCGTALSTGWLKLPGRGRMNSARKIKLRCRRRSRATRWSRRRRSARPARTGSRSRRAPVGEAGAEAGVEAAE